jgi:hypothetical protein
MNLVSIRKRLDRLENIHKARIEAAALASALAAPASPEDEDRLRLFMLWQDCRGSLSGTAEDEAELKRLSALHPEQVKKYEDEKVRLDAMSLEERVEDYKESMSKWRAQEESELRRREGK